MVSISVWAEDHPYLTGATILGIILLILIWRRRSASAAPAASSGGAVYTGPSEGLQIAQLQAGAQLQGMQMAAQIQSQAIDADVIKTYYAGQAHLADTAASADLYGRQIDASLTLGLAQESGSLALAGVQGQVGRYGDLIVLGATDQSMQLSHQAAQQQSIAQAVQAQTQLPGYSAYLPAAASGGAVVSTSPASGAAGISISGPNPGETWDQYYARQRSDNSVSPSYDPIQVSRMNDVWAASYDAYTGDPYSLHNLPAGDWYDSAGRIHSCGDSPGDPRCQVAA